jgi:hypothetical protein
VTFWIDAYQTSSSPWNSTVDLKSVFSRGQGQESSDRDQQTQEALSQTLEELAAGSWEANGTRPVLLLHPGTKSDCKVYRFVLFESVFQPFAIQVLLNFLSILKTVDTDYGHFCHDKFGCLAKQGCDDLVRSVSFFATTNLSFVSGTKRLLPTHAYDQAIAELSGSVCSLSCVFFAMAQLE